MDDGARGRTDRRRTAAPRPWVGQNETDPRGPDLDTPHTPNARGGAIIPADYTVMGGHPDTTCKTFAG